MDLVDKSRFAMKADLDYRNHVAKLALEEPRTVEVRYRGASVKVVVAGAWEEFNVRLDVYLKEITRQSTARGKAVPLLTPLFCEEDLVPTGALVVREVEQAIYSRFNNSRVGANEQLPRNRELISEQAGSYTPLTLPKNYA